MDHAARSVLDLFEKISGIPRCSKKEEKISRWLHQWAESREMSAKSDSVGNLVIQVPATEGFERSPVVVLQGHMDMVCEKRDGSDHDFTKDPIQLVQDGQWVSARETTLGADNGIAIAIALALADNQAVSHPPLELLFTVDEETGLTGVKEMDASLVSGKTLVNLDSEDEGVFVVGCAGGRDTTLRRELAGDAFDEEFSLLYIFAEGMKGGHSGIDIAKHRANANNVAARLLAAGLQVAPFRLVALKGGTGRNVIPRACEAVVACRTDRVDGLEATLHAMADTLKKEFCVADPDLTIQLERKRTGTKGTWRVCETDTAMVVNLLMALPSGPIEMDGDDPTTVQSSANLAMVKIEEHTLIVTTSQRSSVASRLDAVCRAVDAVGSLAGAMVHTNPGYPSWPVDWESKLLARCAALYRELFQEDPAVEIMHAGLECGVIGNLYPGMDMISLGPTIENPHSPSERLHIPSVGKVWRLMVSLLESYQNE